VPVPTEPLPDFSGVWIKVGLLHVTPLLHHTQRNTCACARHVCAGTAVTGDLQSAASLSYRLLLWVPRVGARSRPCTAVLLSGWCLGCLDTSAGARQDFEASDTVDSAMDLVQLNRLLRPAVRLVKGMEVKQAGGIFEFSMMTVVSWFKVRSHNTPRPCNTLVECIDLEPSRIARCVESGRGVEEERDISVSVVAEAMALAERDAVMLQVTERYPLSGDTREFKRRDLRRDMHPPACQS